MSWYPRGFGGSRPDPEVIKRSIWRDERILVVNATDSRLTWPERELIQQLGERLFSPKGRN